MYSNPLPHVLILTAIVVGIATTSVGLALAVRIKEAYGTMEEDEINRIEAETEAASELMSAHLPVLQVVVYRSTGGGTCCPSTCPPGGGPAAGGSPCAPSSATAGWR